MPLNNTTLIDEIESKTFEGNKNFKVSYLSMIFGYKDDLTFTATLVDSTTGDEHKACIKAFSDTRPALSKIVLVPDSDLCLFNARQTNTCDYCDQNIGLKEL